MNQPPKKKGKTTMKNDGNLIKNLYNRYLHDQDDVSYESVNAALFDFAEELAYEFFDEEDDGFDLIIDDIFYELSDYVTDYIDSDFEYDARKHIIRFLGLGKNAPGNRAA